MISDDKTSPAYEDLLSDFASATAPADVWEHFLTAVAAVNGRDPVYKLRTNSPEAPKSGKHTLGQRIQFGRVLEMLPNACSDPIRQAIQERKHAFLLSEVCPLKPLSPEEAEKADRRDPNVDRLIIPVFGKGHYDGFMIACFPGPKPSSADKEFLSVMAQTAHLRFQDYIKRHPLQDVGLTQRESDVAHCLVDGQTNKKIGQTLQISPATVDSHVRNIFDKLGVQNRVSAALLLVRLGMV